MALTEKEIKELSKGVLDIYQDIEDDLLISIVSRIDIEDEIGGTAAWHTKKLSELNGLKRDNIKVFAKYTKKTQREIEKLYEDSAYNSVFDDESTYVKAAQADMVAKNVAAVTKSQAIKGIIANGTKDGLKALNLTNTTALEFTNQDYLDIINTAFIEVDGGFYDYKTSIRKAVNKLGDKGITGQTYKTESGRVINYQLDAAVRREVLTSSLQTARIAQDERAKEYGSDLYEVSSHVGARPKCAIDQGQVYSYTGKTKGYKSQSSTTEGDADGLFGINCKHQKYPFFEGLSIHRENPIPEDENEESYLESQKQRRLENEVRKSKKRLVMFNEMGDTEEFEKQSRLLKVRERRLNTFMGDTGRTQQKRVSVEGFNRSVSSKATHAAKR